MTKKIAKTMPPPNWKHQTIFTGDNLDIMRGMNSGSVDLIYIDPPFNSNADYAAPIGSQAAGAHFKDTWGLSDIDRTWHGEVREKHPALYDFLMAVKKIHGNSMMSYLIYMVPRLMEMHRILRGSGTLYLHVDPVAAHYLKIIMDVIFGKGMFMNEVVWHYDKWTNAADHFQRNHDSIFVYVKESGNHTFNKLYIDKKSPHHERGYTTNVVDSGEGRITQLLVYDKKKAKRLIDAGKYDRVVYREGMAKTALPDVFQIPIINSQASERVGYPTQKPLALLRRIIEASSNKGDIVFDPFCGCATTLVAAEQLDREWIGIDLSPLAAMLVKQRIHQQLGSVTTKPIHRDDIPQRTDLGTLPGYNCAANKDHLYGRQGGDCTLCGVHFEKRNLTVDHIVPQSRGGSHHIDNLQLLCGSCNSKKGARSQAEARLIIQSSR